LTELKTSSTTDLVKYYSSALRKRFLINSHPVAHFTVELACHKNSWWLCYNSEND
jgi:hypothetical protein